MRDSSELNLHPQSEPCGCSEEKAKSIELTEKIHELEENVKVQEGKYAATLIQCRTVETIPLLFSADLLSKAKSELNEFMMEKEESIEATDDDSEGNVPSPSEFVFSSSSKLFSGEKVREFPKEKILFKEQYLAEREVRKYCANDDN